MEREAVALGEAEPIDGRSEDSVVSIVCARSLFLAVGVRSCGVKVRLKGVREKGQRDQQAGRRLRIPGHYRDFHVNKLSPERLVCLPQTSSLQF